MDTELWDALEAFANARHRISAREGTIVSKYAEDAQQLTDAHTRVVDLFNARTANPVSTGTPDGAYLPSPAAASTPSTPTPFADLARLCDCRGDGTGGHADNCAVLRSLSTPSTPRTGAPSEGMTELADWEFADAIASLVASEIGDALAAEEAGPRQSTEEIRRRAESVAIALDPYLASLQARAVRAERDAASLLKDILERQGMYERGGVTICFTDDGEMGAWDDLSKPALALFDDEAEALAWLAARPTPGEPTNG